MFFVPGMDLSMALPVLGEVCLLNTVWLPFALPALHYARRREPRPFAAVALAAALAHGAVRYTPLFLGGVGLEGDKDWTAGCSRGSGKQV